MSNRYQIVASPTFKVTLKKLLSFVAKKFNQSVAIETRQQLKTRVAALSENPQLGPVSERLSAFGITNYRQLLVDEHNLVFYRVCSATRKVILVLAMDSRQSIDQVLFEVMLETD